MALFERMKRVPDKLVGEEFYTAHWCNHGGQPEVFRIVFADPGGNGPGYIAQFTREEAQKIVRQFAQYMQEAE